MANVNFFSPDGGTTRYPIEDTEARSRIETAKEQVYADNGVLGAKNLLPNNAKSQTINGVTFTVNADGSITANGTASARSELIFLQDGMTNHSAYYSALAGKSVILSGCPSGGAFDKYFFGEWDSTNNKNTNDYGEGIELSFPQSEPTNWNIKIRIESGQTVSNLVFKPMLRLASDPDDTYQPYVMTNRELTERIKTIVSEAITEAFSAHSTKWHDNANDCNVGFERTNDYRTSNMPTTGTASAPVWYNIMTVRESNVSTSSSFGYGFQIAVQTSTTSTMGDTYVRAVNGGATPTWSEWKKLN